MVSLLSGEAALAMSIWMSRPVEEEPTITLVRWRIFETEMGQRHFVGARLDESSGRVSSAIVDIHVDSRTGTTESGRVYILVGPPGFDDDAQYVWERWACMNEVTGARDITLELFRGEPSC
jgi:hypothetical protein